MFDSNVYWSNITLIKLNQCPDYVRLMLCSTLERQSPVEHPTCTLYLLIIYRIEKNYYILYFIKIKKSLLIKIPVFGSEVSNLMGIVCCHSRIEGSADSVSTNRTASAGAFRIQKSF
jgi:hypothetical protein